MSLEGGTAQYQDLTRHVKEAEENYQLYQKKQEEARITDELDQNKITNVSMAEAPVQPQLASSPNRPLNLVLGVFLGMHRQCGQRRRSRVLPRKCADATRAGRPDRHAGAGDRTA